MPCPILLLLDWAREPAPRTISAGARSAHVRREPLAQLRVRQRPDAAVGLGARLDQHEQRDAARLVSARELGRLVDVELDELEVAGVLAGEPLDGGRDHA